MQLDDRKWTILKAIIKTYLETGEPVGSRTISKYADLNLSSATIRNEMSDLEEMGFILQPHTSAGRIPSDAGYRLYVDRMMDEKEREVTEMKELVLQRQDKMELLLKQMAKVLAANTNYAAMISGPQYHRTKLKFIQLSVVSEDQILATVVAEGNVVKNKLIEIEHGLDQKTVLEMNILLNSALNGLTIEEINLSTISRLKEQAGIHSDLVNRVLDAVAEAIQSSQDEIEIYTSGATNIFKYPELSTSEKASELINAFENKKELADIISQESNEETGIQVYIGGESPVATMQDCSVVTATYELGEGMYGRIGVIGPKRMDYDKVVSTLKTLTIQLDEIFKKKLERWKRPVEEMKNEEAMQGTVEETDTADKTEQTTVEEPEQENSEAEIVEEEAAQEDQESSDESEEPKKKGLFGKKKKDKKDTQIEELTDRVQRQMAEFDNFRKRTEKEKSAMFEVGAKSVIEKLLPTVDNFERGLASVAEEQKEDPFVQGMEKIYRQMMTTLESIGVKPIEAVGTEFDPNFHNAVMHVEDEEQGENIIVEEFQKGYLYHDSVVRHSMVKVAN